MQETCRHKAYNLVRRGGQVRCYWEVKSISSGGNRMDNVWIPGRMSIFKAHKEGRQGPGHKEVEIYSEGKLLLLNHFTYESGKVIFVILESSLLLS